MGLRKLNRIIIMIGFGIIFYPAADSLSSLSDSLFSRVSSKDTVEVMQRREMGNSSNTTNLLPDSNTCGIQNSDRIFGGSRTDLDEHPWMVLLKYYNGYEWAFQCDGVLISSRYVLTAAHCVVMKKQWEMWRLIYVRLGEWDIRTGRDCIESDCSDAAIEVTIDRKISHKDFIPESIQRYNDIALLRLTQNVNFTDFIKPICLPIASDLRTNDFIGFEMEVAGWGKIENGSRSNVKLKVRVPIVDNKQCNEVYKLSNRTVTTNQICAGGRGSEDSCVGDSGGPLMVKVSNSSNWVAIGIVSYGATLCGKRGWPAVHIKVGSYVNWILSQLEP